MPFTLCVETKNTWHRPDPSFTYLLSFFMALTGLAWGAWNARSAAGTLRLTLIYVFIHFLAVSLLVATLAYFFVGRLLGPGIAGLPGRRRQTGLFVSPQDRETLEFGYCFDVSRTLLRGVMEKRRSNRMVNKQGANRRAGVYKSILPSVGVAVCGAIHHAAVNSEGLLVSLLLTVRSPNTHQYRISYFLGNTLYLVAFGYYFIISFLGYNCKQRKALKPSARLTDSSTTFPASYGVHNVAACGICRFLVRKPFRLQHPKACRAGLNHRHRLNVTELATALAFFPSYPAWRQVFSWASLISNQVSIF